jgi:hypothetical protein
MRQSKTLLERLAADFANARVMTKTKNGVVRRVSKKWLKKMHNKGTDTPLVMAVGTTLLAELDGPKSARAQQQGNLASVLCLLTLTNIWRDVYCRALPPDGGLLVWDEIENVAARIVRLLAPHLAIKISGPKGQRGREPGAGFYEMFKTNRDIDRLVDDSDRVAKAVGSFLLGKGAIDRLTMDRAAVAVVAVLGLCRPEMEPRTYEALERLAREEQESVSTLAQEHRQTTDTSDQSDRDVN